MALKIVTVTIDEQGNADVDLAGFQGKNCHDVQLAFEKALGKGVSGYLKSEYHKPCSTTTKISQNQ